MFKLSLCFLVSLI